MAAAKSLIEKVERKAEEIGVAAVIAVSDAAGRLTAVHCMDGAEIICSSIITFPSVP